MDIEVTNILKKWNLNSSESKNSVGIREYPNNREVFDSKTFTRSKRKTFTAPDGVQSKFNTQATMEYGNPSIESGVS